MENKKRQSCKGLDRILRNRQQLFKKLQEVLIGKTKVLNFKVFKTCQVKFIFLGIFSKKNLYICFYYLLLLTSFLKNHMKKAILTSKLLIAGILLTSCNNQQKPNEHVEVTETSNIDSVSTPINEMTEFKYSLVIANIPSVFEILDMISNTTFKYDQSLINPTENESKYSSTSQKALGFGVYSVDLAYSANNKQNQQTIKLFATSRKLSQQLNNVENFDKVAGARFEKNIQNKDSVNLIINEVYDATDKYLRSNERLEAASLMLTGSWIESQYIILNTLKKHDRNKDTELLYNKVFEQKLHLANILNLLNEYKDKEEFVAIISALTELNQNFEAFKVSTDVTKTKVEEISTKMNAIRNTIIG